MPDYIDKKGVERLLEKERKIDEVVNSMIKDPRVKNILFGDANPDSYFIKLNPIGSVYRLINLVFIFFYAVYTQEKISNSKELITNERVLNNLDRLYISQHFSLEFVLFVLEELQIDSELQRNYEIKKLINSNFKLSKWKEVIQIFSISDRMVEITKKEQLKMMVETIEALPLLQYLSLDLCEAEKNVTFSLRGFKGEAVEYPAYDLVYYEKSSGQSFYLKDLNNEDEGLRLDYYLFDNSEIHTLRYSDNRESKTNTILKYLFNQNVKKKVTL